MLIKVRVATSTLHQSNSKKTTTKKHNTLETLFCTFLCIKISRNLFFALYHLKTLLFVLVNELCIKIFMQLRLFLENIFNFSKFGYLLHDLTQLTFCVSTMYIFCPVINL